MQLKTIVSLVSAATLAAGMGMASAAPPTSQQYPSSQSRMYAHQDTATQVAHEAAAVLQNSTGTTQMQQSGRMGQSPATQPANSQPIPRQVVDSARCIAVFPNVAQAGSTDTAMNDTSMAANGSAATENTGLASCRGDNGSWSAAPVVVKLSSAQIQPETAMQSGMQNGSQTAGNRSAAATTMPGAANRMQGNAVVLLFTSDDAADSLQGGDVEIGDDVEVAPGPTGSAAPTTMDDSTEVLAYQSTPQSGLAGATIHGGKIAFDEQVNKQTYGDDVDPEDLLQGEGESEHTQRATRLIAFNQALNRFAPPATYRTNGGNGGE